MAEEVGAEEELGDEGILVAGAAGPQDVLGVAREIAALLSLAQLRARAGQTERKVRLRAVGQAPGSYWDDVYMVTAIHHHVAISHLRVSKPYLRFLRSGKLPRADHAFVWRAAGQPFSAGAVAGCASGAGTGRDRGAPKSIAAGAEIGRAHV